MGTVTYPVLVFDPEDPTCVAVLESLEDAQSGKVEYFDVKDENFIFWDSCGERVRATIEEGKSHWLKLTASDTIDMPGLREAILRYAEAEGVPTADLEGLAPGEAIEYIERTVEELLRARRGKRRWYEFWRSD